MSLTTSVNAAQFYDAAKQAAQSQTKSDVLDNNSISPKVDFGQVLLESAQQTLNTLKVGEKTAMEAVAGKADAHSVVEALATAEMAVQAAVTVRDKVVEAYQEILRMPV